MKTPDLLLSFSTAGASSELEPPALRHSTAKPAEPFDKMMNRALARPEREPAATMSSGVVRLRRRTRVIVTEGEQGCTLLGGADDAPLHVAAFPVREVDSTGAGDCFLAGFAAGLLRGLGEEQALRLGNFCGAQAVSQVGIPVLDPAAFRRFFA